MWMRLVGRGIVNCGRNDCGGLVIEPPESSFLSAIRSCTTGTSSSLCSDGSSRVPAAVMGMSLTVTVKQSSVLAHRFGRLFCLFCVGMQSRMRPLPQVTTTRLNVKVPTNPSLPPLPYQNHVCTRHGRCTSHTRICYSYFGVIFLPSTPIIESCWIKLIDCP